MDIYRPKVSEIRNIGDINLDELADVQMVLTEKLDGTSVRLGIDGESAWCGGHNHLYEIGGKVKFDAFGWGLFVVETGLVSKVQRLAELIGDNITLFGEFCGPKIQANPYKLPGLELFLFDVRAENRWLPWGEVAELAQVLDLRTVPVEALNVTVTKALLDSFFHTPSLLNPGIPEREGVVVKAVDERQRFSDGKRMIFKYRRLEERKYKPRPPLAAKDIEARRLNDRVDEYLTLGRIEKAVSHLREENRELNFRSVIEELCRDLLKEADPPDVECFSADAAAFHKSVSKNFGSNASFREYVNREIASEVDV